MVLASRSILAKMVLSLKLLFLTIQLFVCDAFTALKLESFRLSTSLRAGTWLPVGSIIELGHDFPKGVEVCGSKYVVWKNGEGFHVSPDVCSHRQAPLSEGRVDPSSGCLECPYHGVQFNGVGECSKIPQLEAGAAIPKAANIASYPVRSTGDMLWAQIPLAAGADFPGLPEDFIPALVNCSSFTTRDLPYSFDYVLENFMDPAHIPFAHHSMQGVRSDGAPIPMSIFNYSDNAAVEVAYGDRIRNKSRQGIVSFQPPVYYHFRVKTPSVFRVMLIILCLPLRPGWSRIHLSLSPGVNLPLPKWILHSFSNKFLDTDLWVHDQERVGRGHINSLLTLKPKSAGVGSYVMPTSSDLGVKSFRRFYAEFLKSHPIFGEKEAAQIPSISLAAKLDRWENHARHCSACQGALRNAQLVQRVNPFVALSVIALAKLPAVRLAAVAVAAVVEFVCRWVVRGVLGPGRGAVVSAARIP